MVEGLDGGEEGNNSLAGPIAGPIAGHSAEKADAVPWIKDGLPAMAMSTPPPQFGNRMKRRAGKYRMRFGSYDKTPHYPNCPVSQVYILHLT